MIINYPTTLCNEVSKLCAMYMYIGSVEYSYTYCASRCAYIVHVYTLPQSLRDPIPGGEVILTDWWPN